MMSSRPSQGNSRSQPPQPPNTLDSIAGIVTAAVREGLNRLNHGGLTAAETSNSSQASSSNTAG